MLKIRLENIGKRYNQGWVFRGLSCDILCGESMAILGSNGSGKSTLLRMLSGSLTPSQGELSFDLDGEELEEDKIYREVTMAAPYLELIQEYTLDEQINFHFKFKGLVKDLDSSEIPKLLHLEKDRTKQIKLYSSGMLQRAKLGLAILSDTPVVLLDEPATNLDSDGIAWYNELLKKYCKDRTVVICSNKREEEYEYCNRELIMEDHK